MSYSTFQEFVSAARAARSGLVSLNAGAPQGIANSSLSALPAEGVIRTVFPGHHLYVKLELAVGLTTSSDNAKRQKNIRLLADLTQGVREIVHSGFDGALLEAQGPVVHAFLPNEEDAREGPRAAAAAIHVFIEQTIRSKAGDDFRKALVAYCHGPSIFVASVDRHGDNSIVSLAPAANAPAKVLWSKADELPSGSTVEVEEDGRYRVVDMPGLVRAIRNRGHLTALNASYAQLPEVNMIANSRELSVAVAGSPDSPTVEDPQESYSISVRADQDGFTRRVQEAFDQGEDAAEGVAEEFHEIMVHARSFTFGGGLIQLPWAGDCFNILIADDSREAYMKNRKRRILEVVSAFEAHMADEFPSIKWAFSCAAGDLEGNQACNTLVSRMSLGDTSILLATGLPVERTMQGLVAESPPTGKGVLWKGDVASLDDDLQGIIDPCPGGRNYRTYAVADVVRLEKSARLASSLLAAPNVYVPTTEQSVKTRAKAPRARPYYSPERPS